MSLMVEQIYEEALQLPDESNPVEQLHLETAKRRRDELRSGRVQPIDGEEGLARVRRTIGITL